mgnify:CR=1 FL=1
MYFFTRTDTHTSKYIQIIADDTGAVSLTGSRLISARRISRLQATEKEYVGYAETNQDVNSSALPNSSSSYK